MYKKINTQLGCEIQEKECENYHSNFSDIIFVLLIGNCKKCVTITLASHFSQVHHPTPVSLLQIHQVEFVLLMYSLESLAIGNFTFAGFFLMEICLYTQSIEILSKESALE